MPKLVDRVRGRFVSALLAPRQFAMRKRTFTLHTELVHDLLHEFIDEHLYLFLKKSMVEEEEDLLFIQGYLREYLFSAIEEKDLLESYDITKRELETVYHAALKGFVELYHDDYM